MMMDQGKEINVGQQVPHWDFKDLQRSLRGFLRRQETININIQKVNFHHSLKLSQFLCSSVSYLIEPVYNMDLTKI